MQFFFGMPAAMPASISLNLSPIIHDFPKSILYSFAALNSSPGLGFLQLHFFENFFIFPVG